MLNKLLQIIDEKMNYGRDPHSKKILDSLDSSDPNKHLMSQSEFQHLSGYISNYCKPFIESTSAEEKAEYMINDPIISEYLEELYIDKTVNLITIRVPKIVFKVHRDEEYQTPPITKENIDKVRAVTDPKIEIKSQVYVQEKLYRIDLESLIKKEIAKSKH